MSEYQYVAFRAIDAPVSEKNLEFMRKQSSHAEVTSWSFQNEYQFGDFHGDAAEMLRRGYDFHFHYSNFGDRKLMIRLSSGLPDPSAVKPYLDSPSLTFLKDKQSPAGILCIEPFFEAGVLDDLWELDGILDRLLPLRAEIQNGDLRPFYLAHLAVASDSNHDPEEEKEAPVPAGLTKLTSAQRAMAELYALDDSLIEFAAQTSPLSPERTENDKDYEAWLHRQLEATKTTWLCQLMADPRSAVRSEILKEYQKSSETPSWPTVRLDRTIAEIMEAAKKLHREKKRNSAK